MLTSAKRKSPTVNNITYHEVQLLYSMTKRGAENRLNIIRASLNKDKMQKLTVLDFCKFEGISLEDFDTLMERAYS